ncbi:hypothetical protein C0Q70_15085 [Pomacea canaliculata]|uniref:Uncharacterized protein n=1 Tax=Pomacea canaliculata TaxID=400727 RepID=A0A2T7NTW3_POMCA|nr:hypothetical protein C0Q70_15085 [Pomacea canaliculata]
MNAAGEELVGNPSPNELLLLNQQTTVREAYRVSLNVGCLLRDFTKLTVTVASLKGNLLAATTPRSSLYATQGKHGEPGDAARCVVQVAGRTTTTTTSRNKKFKGKKDKNRLFKAEPNIAL